MISVVGCQKEHFDRLASGEQHKFDNLPLSYESALTLISGEDIVAIVGGSIVLPGVLYAWAFVSSKVKKHRFSFHRAIKKIVSFYMKDLELRRMQFCVRTDFVVGYKWAISLGFSPEGVMKKYLPDGADAWLFARVQ